MSKPQTAVVGCDGSAAGDSALRFAAAEAEAWHARLVIVAAYDRPLDPDLDDFHISDAELRAQARARTAMSVQRTLGADPPVAYVQEVGAAEGDPGQVLLDHAAGAIMIVIGSHDRTMLQRLFGRAVSRELLHDSTVPVTVVPSAMD